jgi:hypothetical protein
MQQKKFTSKVVFFSLILTIALAATGCGSQPATVADLPVYPGAVELKPGEDPVADTLANNMAQDASLRQGIGAGGSIEQKAFRLPADTSWEAVQGFYKENLEGDGWKSGAGGIASDIVNQALESTNQGNELFQTAMWSKGKQIFTIFRLLEMPGATQPYLIVSLNTN